MEPSKCHFLTEDIWLYQWSASGRICGTRASGQVSRKTKMAQKLGVSETHYSNLERARRTLSLSFLVKFCAVLNIPFERLLSGAVSGIRICEDEAATALTEDERLLQQIAVIIHTCDPMTKQFILDMCLGIAEIDHARK